MYFSLLLVSVSVPLSSTFVCVHFPACCWRVVRTEKKRIGPCFLVCLFVFAYVVCSVDGWRPERGGGVHAKRECRKRNSWAFYRDFLSCVSVLGWLFLSSSTVTIFWEHFFPRWHPHALFVSRESSGTHMLCLYPGKAVLPSDGLLSSRNLTSALCSFSLCMPGEKERILECYPRMLPSKEQGHNHTPKGAATAATTARQGECVCWRAPLSLHMKEGTTSPVWMSPYAWEEARD